MLSGSENKILRNLLIQEVEKGCRGETEVGIGLSSGIDSHVVLFALLELGKRVIAYSFRREDIVSKDFQCAKNTCRLLGLEHKEILVPIQIDKSRIVKLIYEYDLRKKTDIEVIYTMMFVFSEMKQKSVYFGYPDHHFGLSQKAMRYYRKTLELNQKWREINASEKGMRQSTKWIEIGKKEFGLDVNLPLGSKVLVDFFHPFTWAQLNKPKMKQPFLDSYDDYFCRVKVRQPQPLQCGDSGIREMFTQLISSDLNCNQTKNLVKLYRDIADNKPRKSKLGKFIHA